MWTLPAVRHRCGSASAARCPADRQQNVPQRAQVPPSGSPCRHHQEPALRRLHHRGPGRRPGQSITAASRAATGGTPLMQGGSVQLVSAACTGGMPLRHFGLVHSKVAAAIRGRPSVQCAEPVHVLTAAGGGPPPQCGLLVHALAAVVDRPNEPAITAAKTTLCPNSLRIFILTMVHPSDLSPRTSSCAATATVTSGADMGLKPR